MTVKHERRPLWDYLFFDKKLPKKPEVLRIAAATGMSRREVVTALLEFWSWVDDHFPDGFLRGADVRLLSASCPETGEEFFRTMSAVGWLEVRDDGIVVPKAERWFGPTAKRRLHDAQRKWLDRHNPNQCPQQDGQNADAQADKTRTQSAPDSESESENKEPPNPHGKLPPSEFITAWNATPFTKIRAMTAKRLRLLRARASSDDWLANWRVALTRAASLPFCQGVNDRGWRATADWFLRPDTVTKILEGAYDGLGGKVAAPALNKTTEDITRKMLADRQAAEEERQRLAAERAKKEQPDA